jgi:hypothetical protein
MWSGQTPSDLTMLRLCSMVLQALWRGYKVRKQCGRAGRDARRRLAVVAAAAEAAPQRRIGVRTREALDVLLASRQCSQVCAQYPLFTHMACVRVLVAYSLQLFKTRVPALAQRKRRHPIDCLIVVAATKDTVFALCVPCCCRSSQQWLPLSSARATARPAAA